MAMHYDSDSNFSEDEQDYRAAKRICTCAPVHISTEPEKGNSSPNSQLRTEYIATLSQTSKSTTLSLYLA